MVERKRKNEAMEEGVKDDAGVSGLSDWEATVQKGRWFSRKVLGV